MQMYLRSERTCSDRQGQAAFFSSIHPSFDMDVPLFLHPLFIIAALIRPQKHSPTRDVVRWQACVLLCDCSRADLIPHVDVGWQETEDLLLCGQSFPRVCSHPHTPQVVW